MKVLRFSLGLSLPVLAACACASLPSPDTGGGFDEARQRVVDEVVRPESVDHRIIVFGLREPLQRGDEIRPYPMENYEPVPSATSIEHETWFFWIDDGPGAHFVHPNRFVLVPVSGGEITVQEQEWWPELNGEGLWVDSQEYWDPENWAWSNLSVPESARRWGQGGHLAAPGRAVTVQDGGQNWALVINGWEAGQPDEGAFAQDASTMKDLFTASGFSVNHLGPGGVGPAALSSSTFDSLAQLMQSGDTLIVYITAHGREDKSSGNGWAGQISESDLRLQLQKLNPGVHIIVIVEACQSGGFRDGLQDVADMTITSTSNLDMAYGDIDQDTPVPDPNPEDDGSEYSSGFGEDWREVMADPAQQDAARSRAAQQNTGFFVEVAALSHLSATEKDVGALNGWTFPALTRGSAQTRPVVFQDPSGDAAVCGTGESPAEILDPAADFVSMQAFGDEEYVRLVLTLNVDNIAAAVDALPPDNWAVSIGFLYVDRPTPPIESTDPLASRFNGLVRINYNDTTQNFQTLVASFTDGGWVGESAAGTSVYPIGPSIVVGFPADMLDGVSELFIDANAEGTCDFLDLEQVWVDPDWVRAMRDLLWEETLRGEGTSNSVLMTSALDPADDGLNCGTGATVEGLSEDADLGGIDMYSVGDSPILTESAVVLRVSLPSVPDLATAAMAVADPVRFGVSFLDPSGTLPTLDLASVFATSQNRYIRIEFDRAIQQYVVQSQVLGPSGWAYSPPLGMGAAAVGENLEIVIPRSFVPRDSLMYIATFGEVCDAIGLENLSATIGLDG